MKLPPFKLERYFARYEFSAPYLLSSSDCESVTIQDLLDFEPDAGERFHAQWLGYTESQGDPGLRAAITSLYQHIEPEEILVHAGAEEAIFAFVTAILAPGDHVIVHSPCYQSLFTVAEANGCDVTRWETHEADGWELDIDALRQSTRPTTRAIIINSPHNPTGYLMSKEKLAGIVAIAREHNIILFSDEVYRFLEHDPADTLPAACDLYENAVSLGVMSKTFGLPGLRIGWIATHNRQILAAMATCKDYLTICNSAPSEFLATLALQHKEQLIARNIAIVSDNMRLLHTFFDNYAAVLHWVPPRAGSIAFPSILINRDIEQFCAELVEKQGVMLLPSTVYDYGTKNFRLGFGRKNMAEALARFGAFLDSLS